MRGRFARELVRAGRLDSAPRGARERALAALGLESGSARATRFASGAALVAILALILGWGPPLAPITSPVVSECTESIEAPPCPQATR